MALCFYVDTTGKQDLAIRQVNDRHADALVVRPRPCVARSPCIENQVPLREWRRTFAWKKHIFKQLAALYVGKFAAVNICASVEPTIQPITGLVQRKWNIVWFEMDGA